MARQEMVSDLLKSLREEYPEWKTAKPMGEAADCDVCAGGALLLYSAKHKLVDIDDLLSEMNSMVGDDPERGVSLDPEGDDILEDWRFPTPSLLVPVLIGLNSRLEEPDAQRLACEILTANDEGDFDKAERLMAEALMLSSSDARTA